jgi:hypothetical protein
MATTESPFVTPEMVENFIRDGFIVIPDVFTVDEIASYRDSLHKTMSSFGFHHDRMSAQELQLVPRFGGHSQVFYPSWKLKIQEDSRFFGIMSEIWKHTFAPGIPGFESYFSGFNPNQGFFYIDRVNYRLPDSLVAQGGLGLHVDCDPRDPLGDPSKWRPIQASVVLTDCLDATSGGLTVVRGMHTQIQQYVNESIAKHGNKSKIKCGSFTRLHQCHDLVSRIEPVFAPAGSVVLWDNRLPHGTADNHLGPDSREVLFMTFLPNIPRNLNYALSQLENYHKGIVPPDFDRGTRRGSNIKGNEQECTVGEGHEVCEFSMLGRKLMGIEPWEVEEGQLENRI